MSELPEGGGEGQAEAGPGEFTDLEYPWVSEDT